MDDEDDELDLRFDDHLVAHHWRRQKSLWNRGVQGKVGWKRGKHDAASKLGSALGLGTSAVQHAGAFGIAAKIGAGAAAAAVTTGTGGVAVGAAGLALQTGSMVAAVASVKKTSGHIKCLEELNRQTFECKGLPGSATRSYIDHDYIQECIIPYIIAKKRTKRRKKIVATLPVVGGATGLHGLGKRLYKQAHGTHGKNRSFYAHVIARHMVSHDCKLCEALVGELLSPAEYEDLKAKDSTLAEGPIARKMKST